MVAGAGRTFDESVMGLTWEARLRHQALRQPLRHACASTCAISCCRRRCWAAAASPTTSRSSGASAYGFPAESGRSAWMAASWRSLGAARSFAADDENGGPTQEGSADDGRASRRPAWKTGRVHRRARQGGPVRQAADARHARAAVPADQPPRADAPGRLLRLGSLRRNLRLRRAPTPIT